MERYNVLFLDFDGVMCTSNSASYFFEKRYEENDEDQYGELFDKSCIENLHYILEKTENTKIVISSSWGGDLGWERIKEMWKYRNLPGKIIGLTPEIPNACRGQEIKKWLEDNGWPKEEKDSLIKKALHELSPIKNYVIIDDDRGFLIDQIDNFVHTQFKDGLSLIVAEECIKILNKKSGD